MATVFSVRPGYAVAIRDQSLQGAPMRLDLDDWGGFQQRTAIIQGISVARSANHQFLHTLRGFIYIYIFGERIGDLIISGLTLTGRCNGKSLTGFDGVMDYWEHHAAHVRADPIGVEIGQTGFLALMTGVKVDIVNPQAGIGQFMMKLNVVPRE